ncbi:MAG: nuclear transport factor 2 family protein, partial [Bacteroidota bacterium]
TVRKFVDFGMKSGKVLFSHITPAAISIQGNVAIVHYFWTAVEKDADGKTDEHGGRWTDILMKQGDKWLIIGDHGGRTKQ